MIFTPVKTPQASVKAMLIFGDPGKMSKDKLSGAQELPALQPDKNVFWSMAWKEASKIPHVTMEHL
jgi:hypothetical protein